MVHPLLNMTIKGVAWYQGMYLMRRFMNSLLWLHSKVDSRKRAELWILRIFYGGCLLHPLILIKSTPNQFDMMTEREHDS